MDNGGAEMKDEEGFIFFVVWCPQRASPTVRHAKYEEAIAEAHRLAGLNPNCSFYVMQTTDMYRACNVQRVRMHY